jgi:hypothetical protein
MTPDEQNLDMLVAELDRENRLLRARNERLEREAEQQNPVPVTDNTYGYAKILAEAIFKQHFASDEHYASGRVVWGVFDTVEGILTQIDNMVADMVRKPAQPKPWVGLTNAERNQIWREAIGWGDPSHDDIGLMIAIEAILREKNQ